MKNKKGSNVPANQSSSKTGAGFGVRENDAKAGQNKAKSTLRK